MGWRLKAMEMWLAIQCAQMKFHYFQFRISNLHGELGLNEKRPFQYPCYKQLYF